MASKHIRKRQYGCRATAHGQKTLHIHAIMRGERTKAEAEQIQKPTKKEFQTENLKGAATTAATNIAESVGSLFGSNKVKTLERENTVLNREVATHEETIVNLKAKIQTLQHEHSRQLLDM